jgi:heme/copper-type cytochrome/quinol oxidase subunit 4
MKKIKRYQRDVTSIAFAGFVLGVCLTIMAFKEIADSRKKEKK